jgi:hypothetical protein
MPNRKSFDPREKYDHSGRSLEHSEKNDLQPDISEEAPPARASPSSRNTASRARKAPAGR